MLSEKPPAFTGADPKKRIALWPKVDEARRRLEAGDVRAVLEISTEILEEDPDNRVARGLHGQALVGLGRADEGLAELRIV